MTLKSNDPEHIEVSRLLKKALLNRQALESKELVNANNISPEFPRNEAHEQENKE